MKKKQLVEQVFDDCDGDFTPLFADVPFDSEVPEWEFDSSPATDAFIEAFDTLSWGARRHRQQCVCVSQP